METKNVIDEQKVPDSKYSTVKKVGLVLTGVAITLGVGYVANKFGWLPKKVVTKVIENKPVTNNIARTAGKVVSEVTRNVNK